MRADTDYMRRCLRLARRGYGTTSPNPMVGALLVKAGQIIGRGWHERAGLPHAEVVALRDAERHGRNPKGATLYVTLEPCCTHGRTPPCTEAIIGAGIHRVVVGTIDPNPRHKGHGLALLRQAGISVDQGVLAEECAELNEAFNHWIVRRLPLVMVKAAMTMDGKIATRSGESKWITGEAARAYGMQLRAGADAVLVGVNTVLADDPELTVRGPARERRKENPVRRIILDALGRTPSRARMLLDTVSAPTTIVVSKAAPQTKMRQLAKHAGILVAPAKAGQIDLKWLLRRLGRQGVTNLLVEGGGEVNASFLLAGLAHRVAFFYAPTILGGARAHKAVAGVGAKNLKDALTLDRVEWIRLGRDWLLKARVQPKEKSGRKA